MSSLLPKEKHRKQHRVWNCDDLIQLHHFSVVELLMSVGKEQMINMFLPTESWDEDFGVPVLCPSLPCPKG
jgi:hypothetical protein